MMTSKEAILCLYNERTKRYNVHSKHKDWNNEIKAYDKVGDCLSTITKDLERLDELEKVIDILNNSSVKEKQVGDYYEITTFLNKEEYELLKGVLYDEK